ncbi:F-box/FBD/LRR-repeat protein-like protein [Tanacetum coccineum]
MELAHGTRQVSQIAPDDFISSMPDDVISNILDRLQVKDAIRTDIWSRNWRFKWTMLPKLIFDKKFFRQNNFKGNELSELLFHLKGPITKFALFIDPTILDVEDVNRCVLILSRKGIKVLTLNNTLTLNNRLCAPKLELATHIYSCMELKHLNLFHVCFLHSPSFRGFPNLLSLRLSNVRFQGYTSGEFFALCPLLENLRIRYYPDSSEVNLVDIAKLRNLRILCLAWYSYADRHSITSSSLFQLTSLPKLQELTLDFYMCEMLADDVAQKKVPTAFPCLKNLKIYEVYFHRDIQTSCVIDMICGSPNLQTLVIKADEGLDNPHTAVTYSLRLNCNTTRLPQLQNVVLSGFRGLRNEVCLMKFILACSPLLKKIVIKVHKICKERYSGFSLRWISEVLDGHIASPEAEIDIR